MGIRLEGMGPLQSLSATFTKGNKCSSLEEDNRQTKQQQTPKKKNEKNTGHIAKSFLYTLKEIISQFD